MSLGKKPYNVVRYTGIVENGTCHRHRLFIDAQHQNSFPQGTPAEFADDMEEFFNKEPEQKKQDKRTGKKDRKERDRHMDNALPGDKIISEAHKSYGHRSAEGGKKKFEKIDKSGMPDDARKRTEHKHEYHTHPHNQKIHESPVREYLNRIVTQLFYEVTRKKDRE